MDRKRVLTVAEVAKALNIGTALVYRQIKGGVIPSIKIGDRYLVPIGQFEKYLAGRISKGPNY
ncbi:helix-turn-helix domain-containing protein [Chloroflexota bacterium]